MSSIGRQIYKVHRWTGLIAGLVVIVLGISGALLVFHEELEALEYGGSQTVVNSQKADIDKALKSVVNRYPRREIRLQHFSTKPTESFIFSIRKKGQRLTVFVHPSNGTIIREMDSNKTAITWILTFHYSLHAGLTGEIIILTAGLALFISILTGIIIYRKAFADVLLFRIKFKHKKRRAVASSLHRYIGVWALFLNIFIVLSGLLISYEIVSKAIKGSAKPKIVAVPPMRFSMDSCLNVLKSRYPDFHPSYMRLPLAEGKPFTITGEVEEQAFFWSKYYNVVTVNAETGEINDLQLNTEADTSMKLSSIARAIHFVEFGNVFIKILFFLAGLSGPVLSVTGFLLWKWRTKRV